MKRTTILLMIIAIVSKIIGFGREMILSYFYGASNITDAYLISLTIPTVIFSFIITSISTGYIPIYSQIEKEYGQKEGQNYTNNLLNILLILITIMIGFSSLFTEQIVRIFASGFEGATLALAIKFTKVSLVGIYFTGIFSILCGFMQIKGKYMIPALIVFPLNLIIILSIILSVKFNVMILAIGGVMALVVQVALMIPFVRKEGYRYKPVLDIKDKNIKKMAYIALPVIIGASVNQINLLIDRTLASLVTVGGISALSYSNKLNLFVQGIFVASIATVIYPTISRMVAENNMSGFKKSIAESINTVNILIIPATVGAMIFSGPIVSMIFGRGAFDSSAITLTSSAFFFYSIGMAGYGLREILAKSFYALQDTKTPMINGTIGVILNIILNIILSKCMGIGGLALATSISAIFTTGLLFISLRKKIGAFGMKGITISFVKALGASLVMGLAAKLSFNGINAHASQNLALIAAIGVGAVVYGVMIYFMKIEEVDSLIGMVKGKIGDR